MQSPRSSRRVPGARRATSPHLASSSFRPVRHIQAVVTSLSSRGRSPPKEMAAIIFSTIAPGPKVQIPPPPPLAVARQLTTACASPWQTCGARAAVVPLWVAAVDNQRRQPLLGRGASAGAAGFFAVPPCGAAGAARVRGRLTGSRTILRLGRPAVVPLQLALPGSRLQFEHLQCWDESHGDSCVCGARSRPVVSTRAEVCPCVPYRPHGTLTSHVRVGWEVSRVRVSVWNPSSHQASSLNFRFARLIEAG